MGDNLLKKSDNMSWWSGQDIDVDKKKMHIDTLYDCLNDMCSPPGRNETSPMRMPVSGIYKIKEEVINMPTHTTANACGGKVFTIEMHHTRHEIFNLGRQSGNAVAPTVTTMFPMRFF